MELVCIIMATIKQEKALDKMVENGGSTAQAMRESGYSEATINTPQKLTESDGFKQLLEEKGLTKSLIVESLVEDIKAKPGKRLGELQLGTEITGMKKESPETEKGDTYIINPRIQVLVNKFEEEYRKELEK